MVKVRVRFLQEYYFLVGKHEVEMELKGESPTIRDLLQALPADVREKLLEEGDRVKPPNEILVNGRSIAGLDGLDTRLKEGDLVVILPRPLFVV